MEKEKDFFLVESLKDEEMKESFLRFKRNIMNRLSSFRKNSGDNVRVTDLALNLERFIRIDIDGIFNFEGRYEQEYSFDEEEDIYGTELELVNIAFSSPVTGISAVFEFVINDMKKFTGKSNLTYRDDASINIIDDFVRFADSYLKEIVNHYSMVDFNCISIRKYGNIVQIGAENRPEMENDYKLASFMNFVGSENKKRFYTVEEIRELGFFDRFSYENIKVNNKEISN